LDVIDVYDAPTIVYEYLTTQNEELRDAAWYAAKAAAWYAAKAAARAAAWDAARAAAWDAARAAKLCSHGKRLTAMINAEFRRIEAS
jgi:hypothetical protein